MDITPDKMALLRTQTMPSASCASTALWLQDPDVDFDVDFLQGHIDTCEACQQLITASHGLN